MSLNNLKAFPGNWDRKTIQDILKKDPNSYFVYGDNLQGSGKGGQAVIRGLPNTIGVPTKVAPRTDASAFFNDKRDFLKAKKALDTKFNQIRTLLSEGKTVYISSAGLGTGRADLKNKAPRIFSYLQSQMGSLKFVESKGGQAFAKMPMNFAYGKDGLPDSYPTTIDEIFYGQRRSTLRKHGSYKHAIGDVVEVFDNKGKRGLVEIKNIVPKVGMDRLEEVSQSERWTKDYLQKKKYLSGGYDWIQYEPVGLSNFEPPQKPKWSGSKFQLPLKQIISGGQVGADEAGLRIGKALGIPTGGTMPPNYIRGGKSDPGFAERFGLTEGTKGKYKNIFPERTRQNILNSDGTIIFSKTNPNSPGTKLTKKFAKDLKKPFLLNPKNEKAIIDFIKKNNVEVLNVAGNRVTPDQEAKKLFTALKDYSRYGTGKFESVLLPRRLPTEEYLPNPEYIKTGQGSGFFKKEFGRAADLPSSLKSLAGTEKLLKEGVATIGDLDPLDINPESLEFFEEKINKKIKLDPKALGNLQLVKKRELAKDIKALIKTDRLQKPLPGFAYGDKVARPAAQPAYETALNNKNSKQLLARIYKNPKSPKLLQDLGLNELIGVEPNLQMSSFDEKRFMKQADLIQGDAWQKGMRTKLPTFLQDAFKKSLIINSFKSLSFGEDRTLPFTKETSVTPSEIMKKVTSGELRFAENPTTVNQRAYEMRSEIWKKYFDTPEAQRNAKPKPTLQQITGATDKQIAFVNKNVDLDKAIERMDQETIGDLARSRFAIKKIKEREKYVKFLDKRNIPTRREIEISKAVAPNVDEGLRMIAQLAMINRPDVLDFRNVDLDLPKYVQPTKLQMENLYNKAREKGLEYAAKSSEVGNILPEGVLKMPETIRTPTLEGGIYKSSGVMPNVLGNNAGIITSMKNLPGKIIQKGITRPVAETDIVKLLRLIATRGRIK